MLGSRVGSREGGGMYSIDGVERLGGVGVEIWGDLGLV